MLDLRAGFAFGKCHVEGDPGDNRLPGLILRKTASFNRTP